MINLSLQHQAGAIAGWRLDLRPIKIVQTEAAGFRRSTAVPSGKVHTFTSDDFRGTISATMVGGLTPGSYTIVVEDVSEQDFKKLTEATVGNDPLRPLQAHVYLFWADAPLPTLGTAGLVAILRVTALRRRPGKWRYEMVVDGREWVYDRLTLPCPEVTGDGALGAAVNLARAMGVELDAPPAPVSNLEKRTSDRKLRGIDQMREYETAMVAAASTTTSPRAGLGMYLIRDGKLQIGPDRLNDAPVRTLDADGGLLFVERAGAVRENETPLGIDDDPNEPHRDLFVATLRGRPDLKPGDVVKFEPPERGALGEELGFALGPAPQLVDGTHITAYIQEVTHRLSREQGFLTTVRSVAASSHGADAVERLWFDGTATDSAARGGSGESLLVRIFDRVVDAARAERLPDVAQVRAHHLATGDPATPLLTEKLWRGLENDDGALHAAGRLRFAKISKELPAAPYATPFAFGSWGLVLPRYPGTRVLLVNRGGNPDDPVDVGALWSRGSGPAAAQTGDWWLCLPVDIDGDGEPRASVGDQEAAEPPTGGNASNDLIDAHGNRVIEVGKLTIRVDKDGLLPPSERPVLHDEPVSIFYGGGKAWIRVAEDGAITITTQKALTLEAAEGITLDSGGGVTIKARGQVDVQKKT